ncbi:GNAT family N-acetyltransferase [Rhodohalobacter sp. SW132]|uniref:GNAT family N-acetyltransferase n=1 Tax=Rhodohalobacter sp. SW132 TaxID=2293433 RepID=UPI000E23D274|nr:GNAT family N-acetyltransferase [Rhodohalobacter sp. SW132]REL37830.1 GNAT family N-acetyltransferase [Rhodohalobacter sp. SW132]
MQSSLSIKTVTGSRLMPYTDSLASLRIEVFREFPYLYDGSQEYELSYLKTYLNSENSIAVLVMDGDQVVGASTGLPMTDEEEDFRRPFQKHGLNPENYFYCGESILKREYRGRGIYRRLFEERESHAKKISGIHFTCFCAVQRPDDHPLRPDDYQPLDPIWQKYGYKKKPELRTTYRWKDIDEESESDKIMVFWVKEITSFSG